MQISEILQPLDDIDCAGGLCEWSEVANARDEIRRRLEAALSAAEPQPAPSVVVKALRWKGPDSCGEYHSLDGLWGYIIRAGNGNGFWLTEIGDYFPSPEAAQDAAQSDYEARILSALSAQVQDEAGWQSQVTHEDICNTHEGGPCNCDWSAADEYQAHPDDIAVDRFAAVMKAKLTKKRDEGRGGWEDKDECSQIFLSQLLREHVEKGDPVDVGNLAMMLHQRGERIASLLEALQGE